MGSVRAECAGRVQSTIRGTTGLSRPTWACSSRDLRCAVKDMRITVQGATSTTFSERQRGPKHDGKPSHLQSAPTSELPPHRRANAPLVMIEAYRMFHTCPPPPGERSSEGGGVDGDPCVFRRVPIGDGDPDRRTAETGPRAGPPSA
eukprot:7390931-Prymnesium_polylepis.3